jgi:DNA repair protein RecO (recombination protein O)
MNWEDEGFLISKRKFRENGNIINVFTNKFGKVSGVVYGGNSRKIRNFLQISNKIFVFYKSKSENKLGYFKAELIDPISPKYFNDKKRTSALLSTTALLNSLLPDSQPNKKIYNSFMNILETLDLDNWPFLYVLWELNLIKELGFDPNLNKLKKINYSNDVVILDIDGIKYKVPTFLINEVIPESINNDLIKNSLIFTRLLLLNKFFIPNNLIFPKSRIILENYFKF